MDPGGADVADLVQRARSGDARAVARLISMVEAQARVGEVMRAVAAYSGGGDERRPHGAHVVGLTGPPGVGKSTSTSALITQLRSMDLRVGVLAIDPTSPFTGGALLGDRIRMQEHALDPGVFIRSMATRGQLGGLSATTPQAVRVLGAAGCDVVLIETVGVGQSEVEISRLADTTIVFLAPGMGDGIQAAKAGVVEIGDIFAVNKSDRDGADRVRRDLRTMLAMTERQPAAWTPPIVKTVATTGLGFVELGEQIAAHLAWSADSGALAARRQRRARDEIEAIAFARLQAQWGSRFAGDLGELARQVRDGSLDADTAAQTLIDTL